VLAAVPGTEERIRFLQTPAAHAGHAGSVAAVETIETHMSWVFLVGDHALKMKKAVRYPFLDFSTLAAREHDCREELRLNARLAPGVYLGLLALRWQAGVLSLQPPEAAGGQTLDWLVLMRRLPAGRLLDRLIASQQVTPEDIAALAGRLVEFYRHADPVRVDAAEVLARQQREQALNRELLLRPGFAVPGAAPALDGFDAALLRHAGLLRQRADAGRIVDGHGDLRPEHVCLLPPPVVIDCLEFNAALRAVDPFDELAFLGLECEMAGAAWIAPQLITALAAGLGDTPPPPLLPLYTASRALLRARLALAHLLEPQPRLPKHWAPLAQRYVERALTALRAAEALEGNA
jgi:aminoglycoside phosphotransferase family enzyme